MRGLNRTRGAIAAVFAALALTLMGAGTAAATVPGGLQAKSCVGLSTAGGCVAVGNLGGSTAIVVSPNEGRHVYVATTNNALLTFDREPTSGVLTLKDCIRAATPGCRALPAGVALNAPSGIAITPDGSSVYVASRGNDQILQFNRDGAQGWLVPKPGAACVGNTNLLDGCTDVRVLNGVERLVIDRDGRHLYAASSISSAVTGFHIGPGGALIQIENGGGLAGCVQATGTESCDDGKGLAGAKSLALSPDGGALYVASETGKSLAVILRDQTSGRLAMSTDPKGCVEDVASDACTNAPAEFLNGGALNDIAVGARGELYVTQEAGPTNHPARVLTFDRDGDGLVRRTTGAGCVSQIAAPSCTPARGGLTAPTGIVTSADGADVYVTGEAGGVVELNRDLNTGTLTPRADTRGCLIQTVVQGTLCTGVTSFGSPAGIAMAPDGRHVYAATSAASGRVSTLRRDSSGPVCENVSVTVGHGFVGPLHFPCSDRDGDKLKYTIINPPTLGSTGLVDNDASTIIYAAPQGQNGSTTFTFRAAYTDFGEFTTEGSIQVITQGAPAVQPGPGPGGLDADGDGFTAGQDCNDGNRNIRPGSTEIKGNNIDENCDGVAEPFPTLGSGVSHNWSWTKGGTFTLKILRITQQFPKGWKVQIKCSGKRCPFKTKALKAGKVSKQASNVLPSLTKKQRRFRAGQTVEIWVSAPSFNTKVARIALKKGKQPAIVPYCVLPGSSKVQKTCA